MSSTTLPSTADPSAGDPSLAALTPLPTRARSLLLMAVATALLVGAWFSPDLLRPGLDTTSGLGGTSVTIPADGNLLTVFDLPAVAPVGGEVVSVGDVDGSTVVGAWLVQPPPAELPLLPWDDQDRPSTDEVLAQAFAPGVLDGAALPQSIRSGQVQLAVLWNITDCAALDDRAEIPITVRNRLGMTFEQRLSEVTGPAFALDGLEPSEGLCPPTED